jgi:hypothetical protein
LNAEIFKKNNFLEEKYFVNENEESIWDIHEYFNFLKWNLWNSLIN